jgi:integrase
MSVSDRWHLSHPADDAPRCGEHRGKVASSLHGCTKRWQVRFRDNAGEQRAEVFERLTDAQERDAEVRRSLATGRYIDRRAGKTTVAEYAQTRWLPSLLHLRPRSIERYKTALETNVLPKLGKRQMGSLRPADIRSFIAYLVTEPSERTRRPLSPSSVKLAAAVVKMILTAAVDDGLIAANPARKMSLPMIEKTLVHPLTAAQVLALAGDIVPRYRVAVLLGALAGLREGEVLGLRGGDVDFLRRCIRIRQQAQNAELVPLKTKASTRTLPADDLLLQEISAHMAAFPLGPQGTLILNREGETPKRTAFGNAWRDAVEKANVPKGARFHDLRHFYASVLIGENLNPKVIQERMGHSNIRETFDTYGHLFPASGELGRGVFDGLFQAAGVHGKCNDETGS